MEWIAVLESIVVIAVIALVVGGAVAYIVKQKKSGAKCIGCPYAKECASKKSCKG